MVFLYKNITVTTSGNKTLRFVGLQISGNLTHTFIANVRFIASTPINETCINGALINSSAIPIINPTYTDNTNQGTGFFWNTNTKQRTDLINYAGLNGTGGFDFWTVNGLMPPKTIASISNSGDFSCNTLTATNV